MTLQIRIGIEGGRRQCLRRATEMNAPILVSANSMWDNRRQKFSGWACYSSHDTALDSGGFVAMKRYGGYRWSIPQYVGLAKAMAPAWWAQMDFCCEPEIASDRKAVSERISRTARHLQECLRVADGEGVAPPMPVLQGWRPSDYCQGPIHEKEYRWPDLVGIGSVCRRRVAGPHGIMAVIAALDAIVPRHVRFHLFGVKSQAIAKLVEHFPSRVASMDSMAWNVAFRWDAIHGKVPRTEVAKAEVMAGWYLRQSKLCSTPPSRQLVLL